MDSERDGLDRLIDRALASYSGAEPPAGLEERVVNRVRVARARRRAFACAVVAAVAASILVGIVVRVERRVVVPKPGEMAKGAPATAVPGAMKPAERVRHVVRRRQARALPKLEQFPTPEPLTAEERAMVAFVERSPREAQQVVDALNQGGNGPIQIAPVEIAPLHSDGAQ